MKTYNKIIFVFRYIVYFLVIIMSFSGCISSGELKEPSFADKEISEISKDKTNNSELKGDLELQIFIGGFGEEFWNEAIDDFKKEYPNVNIIKHMGSSVNSDMTPRWLSGNPPDFAFIDGPGFPENLTESGMLLDLKDWFDTTKTWDGTAYIKDNIYKGFINEVDGKIYSAPYVYGTLGMWYNEKLFRDNNLKVPTNFEEFLSLAPILKSKNIALMNYPGQFPNYLYLGFLRQNLASEGGQQILNDISGLKPGIFKSELFYKSMYKIEVLSKTDNAILKNSLTLNHIDAQKEWLQGKSAFIPNGLWLENEMKNEIPSDFEITFIPSLIQDKGKKYVVCAYAHNLCLAKNGKNPEAAKEWLRFLYREYLPNGTYY
jgi:N-acetylglucosamine transport system substrate-binding protein